MTDKRAGLADPDHAAFAWRRYRRIMRWMALASALITAAAILLLDHYYGPLSFISIVAAIGGFFGTAMMTSALMGLVFLSSGSGHDDAIKDFER